MASVVTYSDGLRRIEFSFTTNGPRKAIRLGRVSARIAESVKARIETIIADKMLHRPHDGETVLWLGQLDEKMLARLRSVGLADGVGLAEVTLGDFMKRFFATLTGKPSTRTSYGNVRRNLEDYLSKGKLLRDLSAADADGWRAWLVEHEKLAGPTISRRVIAARTMWRRAMRWKLAVENPFCGVKAGHQANEARKVFVSREVIDPIIAEAPDTEWKVIIALARYGGLRCPSEHYALKWGDIDWDRGSIRVACPKLAHHEQSAYRIIPLFLELREHLLKLFEEAQPGAEFVIARHRLGCLNLRQQFERIIARAGVKQWPKLFHNLRASRESELMREYDLATVCKWIGNSPTVAAKHYAVSTDLNADFRRATGLDMQNEAQQKAQQTAPTGDEQAMTSDMQDGTSSPENGQSVISGQPSATAVDAPGWAVQGSNL